MSDFDNEDRLFQEDVDQVKRWWKDSRWRHTKRPFSAEQIVAKRGNLKVDYPSNAQSKKLWKILESRFQVGYLDFLYCEAILTVIRIEMPALHTAAWNPPCSLKWLNIWTLSMFLAGNLLLRLRQRTNHPRISPITQW